MFDSSGEMVSGPQSSNRSIWSTLRRSDCLVGIAPLFLNSRVSQSISPSASIWRRSIIIFGGEEIKEKSEIICWRLTGENSEILSCQGSPRHFFLGNRSLPYLIIRRQGKDNLNVRTNRYFVSFLVNYNSHFFTSWWILNDVYIPGNLWKNKNRIEMQ